MDKSGIQQTNTYPVEIFSEMHYSQAYKSQDPPRIEASEKAVVIYLFVREEPSVIRWDFCDNLPLESTLSDSFSSPRSPPNRTFRDEFSESFFRIFSSLPLKINYL